MPDKLKPCPFCGEPPFVGEEYVEEFSSRRSYITCKSCMVRVAHFAGFEKASECWNTRKGGADAK